MKKVQLRGHCQCCGRQQAVPNGLMSNHGYTVENGWFNGVCSGHSFKPMEQDRKVADQMVAQVREDAEALEANAKDYESGKIFPAKIRDTYSRDGKAMIAWASAADWQKEQAIKSLVFGLRRRAEIGREFANMIEKIADEVHGKPLIQAAKPEPAARIEPGEKRVNEVGKVMIARYQDGARVYWKDECGFQSWTGSKRWRSLLKKEG